MAETSKIEWTDATWTPIRAKRTDSGKVGVHCEKVSPACQNCYAERLNMRSLPNHGTGLEFNILNASKVEIIVDDNLITAPLKWKRPRRIFVCSQTDLFGGFVASEHIAHVFAVMALAHRHTFQVLTKRANRMQQLLSDEAFWDLVDCGIHAIIADTVDPLDRRSDDLRATAPEVGPDEPLSNVWLGVTAETQEWAEKRIPHLLQTPAAQRFVSCEPLLGPIDLTASVGDIKWVGGQRGCDGQHKGDGSLGCPTTLHHHHDEHCKCGLDWVIVGGESGPNARPMHPAWARIMRDQCQAAGVPFFFKQWGEWAPWTPESQAAGVRGYARYPDFRTGEESKEANGAPMVNIGKKNAGRLLDGREWNEVPE